MADAHSDEHERAILEQGEKRVAAADANLKASARELESSAETLGYSQTELKRTASIIEEVTAAAREIGEEMEQTREVASELNPETPEKQ
jgi:hypothetical protein